MSNFHTTETPAHSLLELGTAKVMMSTLTLRPPQGGVSTRWAVGSPGPLAELPAAWPGLPAGAPLPGRLPENMLQSDELQCARHVSVPAPLAKQLCSPVCSQYRWGQRAAVSTKSCRLVTRQPQGQAGGLLVRAPRAPLDLGVTCAIRGKVGEMKTIHVHPMPDPSIVTHF